MILRALPAMLMALFLGMQGADARPVGAGKIIYQSRDWRVQVIGFRDGAAFCVAEVMAAPGKFSIWSDGKGRVRLVFTSPRWDFRGGKADLGLRIDERAPWWLGGALLLGHSAVFELQDPEKGSALLRDLRKGRRVVLLNRQGRRLGGWSLRGSNAALDALGECNAALGQKALGSKALGRKGKSQGPG